MIINKLKNNRGSLSLEAAIALPIFIFAFFSIISWIEIFRAYGEIETSMCRSGREIALYSSASELIQNGDSLEDLDSSFISTVLSDGYTYYRLETDYINGIGQSTKVTQNNLSILSLANSNMSLSEDKININITYKVSPLVNYFDIFGVYITNSCYLHPWTGYSISENTMSENEERMVYVTETGTVYHLSKSCTYLDLSIQTVSASDISSSRNLNGSTYSSCELCDPQLEGLLFITSYGDRYHCSLTCSGLKRTINEIPLSEASETLNCCSRCKNKND